MVVRIKQCQAASCHKRTILVQRRRAIQALSNSETYYRASFSKYVVPAGFKDHRSQEHFSTAVAYVTRESFVLIESAKQQYIPELVVKRTILTNIGASRSWQSLKPLTAPYPLEPGKKLFSFSPQFSQSMEGGYHWPQSHTNR